MLLFAVSVDIDIRIFLLPINEGIPSRTASAGGLIVYSSFPLDRISPFH